MLPHLCFRHKNCWMPWMSKQFLLECCPCLSMLFSMFSSLLDRIDTLSWKSSITFCFSFLSFSNFLNLFSEYLFLKTPLDSCFETSNVCVIYPNSMIYFPVQLYVLCPFLWGVRLSSSTKYLKINSRGVLKTLYNIKNESFCENNWWLQRRIRNSVKYVRWSFFKMLGESRSLPNI